MKPEPFITFNATLMTSDINVSLLICDTSTVPCPSCVASNSCQQRS